MAMVILVSAALCALHPFNAVAFLFLSTPFYLGEPGWPYEWLPEAVVYMAALSAAVHHWREKIVYSTACGPLVFFFLAATVLSLPLDAKEFQHDLWAASWRALFDQWRVGHMGSKIHYLRTVMNTFTAVCLFIITAQHVRSKGALALRPYLVCFTAIAGAVCLVAIPLAHDMIPKNPERWSWLSLSVVGKWMLEPNLYIMTGFAYAAHFFNQYLLLAFPLTMATMFIYRKRQVAFLLFSTTLGLEIYCLTEGGLRSSMALIVLTLAVGACAGIVYLLSKGPRTRTAMAILVIALLAAAGARLAMETLAYKRFTREITAKLDSGKLGAPQGFINDPLYFYNRGITEPRLILWHTAVRMFAHSPALGVGAGRFTALFREFYAGDPNNATAMKVTATETAHSIYFESLADQGALGLSLWLGVIVCTMTAGGRAFARSRNLDERATLLGMFTLVSIWMLLGLTHHIALCRAMEFIFWFALGAVAGAGPEPLSMRGFPKSVTVVLSVLLILGALWQVKNIFERPLPKSFGAGFYHWERQADGSYRRWMGRRGAFFGKVMDGKVSVEVSCPIPGLDQRPQKVSFTADGEKKELTLNNANPTVISLNAVADENGLALIKMETSRLFNPKKDGGHPTDDRDLGVMLHYHGG